MDEQERARQIAQVIQEALQRKPAQDADAGRDSAHRPRYTVTRQGGCLSCDPGSCWECGYLFSGERIIIHHAVKGERVLSDRTVHLLAHGITHYQTKYVVYGEPVIVDLDLDELAGYLDM